MPGMISVPSKARFKGRSRGSSLKTVPRIMSRLVLGILAIVASLHIFLGD